MSDSSLKGKHSSWGRYPRLAESSIKPIYWRDETPDFTQFDRSVLPVGYGRSYGDSCRNDNGIGLDTTHLNRFIAFDRENGILRCEAGVSLAEVLNMIVPAGWFLPVTPGTKFVSVAGAVANDIHGKNHHRAGTFGCHVTAFELLRSSGERMICSPTDNSDYFRATIGGLGLTGIILWAEFRLKKIANPFIHMERIRFGSLDEFMEITASSDKDYEYTVSWMDCLSSEPHLARGLFWRGNHATEAEGASGHSYRPLPLRVPFDVPSFVINKLTVKLAIEAIYRSQLSRKIERIEHYNPFFYPLDTILDWNRGYGAKGFLQYQFVVPYTDKNQPLREILAQIRAAEAGSITTVFKTFGSIQSPGMLSFPRPGITLALDFPFRGQKTLDFLDQLDRIVHDSGGAIYPAKDARMSAENFKAFYPAWQDFSRYIDPCFSSSFWRRVTATNGNGHRQAA